MEKTSKTYSFREQLDIGKQGEEKLDAYFYALGTEIRCANMFEQKRGIDRWFRAKDGDRVYTVEYKTDEKTQKTGNVFVETISNNQTGALGWAVKGLADFVIYYAVGIEEAAVIRSEKLREKIAEWFFSYPTKAVKNRGYMTYGILVPWEEFKKAADTVIKFD